MGLSFRGLAQSIYTQNQLEKDAIKLNTSKYLKKRCIEPLYAPLGIRDRLPNKLIF
jgi:hypothetical protein